MKSGDLKELWIDEAYNILANYIPVEDMPPPGYLQTNIQTAVNSAYHGARWQRFEKLQDVYPYLQYKTQDDEAVRDEHRILHDKIFRANDPIWETIYPPNGWNCRCYVTPLTIEEVSSSGIQPENIADENTRREYIRKSGIAKEFSRNPGQIKSIYSKWLQSKLQNKVYEQINRRLISYASKLPDVETIITTLNNNPQIYRWEKISKDKWEKEFPGGIVSTPLGEFKMGAYQYDKLKAKKREYLFGVIKPTLENPQYILIDNNDSTLFLSSFIDKDKGKNIIHISVLKYKDRQEIIVSNHERNNVGSLVKRCKLLVFTAPTTPADPGDSAYKKLTEVGRLNEINIRQLRKKINCEIWGEIIYGKSYATVVRKIIYGVEGIEIDIIKNGKVTKKSDDYNINNILYLG